jgi:hypothetical protein
VFFRKKQNPYPYLSAQPKADRSGNFLILGLAVLFGVMTLGMLMLRPPVEPTNADQIAAAQPTPAPAPVPEPEPAAMTATYVEPTLRPVLRPQPASASTEPAPVQQAAQTNTEVTRAALPILNVTQVSNTPNATNNFAARDIARALRQPVQPTTNGVRVIDLPALTSVVLTVFSAQSQFDTQLKQLTQRSVGEQQSDAYVTALLNSAVERNRLTIPAALLTPEQTLDGTALLNGMREAAGDATLAPTHALSLRGTHRIEANDSLAGIAMQYYGRPLAPIPSWTRNCRCWWSATR